MSCSGGCLSGELFAGVLVGVVVATNTISIILTYVITKNCVARNSQFTNVTFNHPENTANDSRMTQVVNHPPPGVDDHDFSEDSDFSTDSELDEKYTNQELRSAASQPQTSHHQQDMQHNDAVVSNRIDSHKPEKAQMYDEPEGFLNVTQSKISSANSSQECAFTSKSINSQKPGNDVVRAQIYDEPADGFANASQDKVINNSSPQERDLEAVNTESVYLQPNLRSLPTVELDNPSDNHEQHVYENHAMQEDEYEELDGQPPLPKKPPPIIKRKPHPLPKPL